MSYRPPTTSKYAPADPAPGRRPATFASHTNARTYQPRFVAKEVPKAEKPLTAEDFPAISSAWKPVSKSNSASSLASNATAATDRSNFSATSESSTKPLTMAERMKIKLAEEEEARQKREEEERRNRDKTAEEIARDKCFENMVLFSRITERVAEDRWKSNGYPAEEEVYAEGEYDAEDGFVEYEDEEY